MSGRRVIDLVEKIITSTPNAIRAVAVIVAVVAVVAGALWLLKADLTVGPFSVIGR